MNKKLLIALCVSLALNFIFIGFEAAKACHRPSFAHIPPTRPEFAPRHMPDNFGSPELKLMHKSFKKALKNYGKELKEAKNAVEETLKAEPFNAEAFRQALENAARVRSAVDEAVQENMTEMVSKMSPEERLRFAESFDKGQDAFKPKKGGKHFFRPEEEHRRPCPCPCAEKAFRHEHPDFGSDPRKALRPEHEDFRPHRERNFRRHDCLRHDPRFMREHDVPQEEINEERPLPPPPPPPFAKHIKPKLNKKFMKEAQPTTVEEIPADTIIEEEQLVVKE